MIAAATALATTGTVRLDRAWTTTSVPRALLWAAVMFLATALYEEIAFRGFLFPQLYLKFTGSDRARFWMALLASQVVFAAAHIPGPLVIRQWSGATLWTQVALQGAGTMSWEIFLLALLVGWPWLTRRPEHRGLAGVERVRTTPSTLVDALTPSRTAPVAHP